MGVRRSASHDSEDGRIWSTDQSGAVDEDHCNDGTGHCKGASALLSTGYAAGVSSHAIGDHPRPANVPAERTNREEPVKDCRIRVYRRCDRVRKAAPDEPGDSGIPASAWLGNIRNEHLPLSQTVCGRRSFLDHSGMNALHKPKPPQGGLPGMAYRHR